MSSPRIPEQGAQGSFPHLSMLSSRLENEKDPPPPQKKKKKKKKKNKHDENLPGLIILGYFNGS